jgi:hypothetical protein
MVYLVGQFHTPSSDGSVHIAIQWRAKCRCQEARREIGEHVGTAAVSRLHAQYLEWATAARGKHQAQFLADGLLGLLFPPEDGGNTFLQDIA